MSLCGYVCPRPVIIRVVGYAGWKANACRLFHFHLSWAIFTEHVCHSSYPSPAPQVNGVDKPSKVSSFARAVCNKTKVELMVLRLPYNRNVKDSDWARFRSVWHCNRIPKFVIKSPILRLIQMENRITESELRFWFFGPNEERNQKLDFPKILIFNHRIRFFRGKIRFSTDFLVENHN